MSPLSDADLHTRYRDVLAHDQDAVGLNVVRDLDAAYTGPKLPPPYRKPIGLPLPHSGRQMAGPVANKHPRKSWNRWIGVAVASLIVVLSVAGVWGAQNILNLGKPINVLSPNPYFPLSGFHRMHGVGHLSGKAVVTLVSTQVDAPSAFERWPLVKALEQFGTLTHVGQSSVATAFAGRLPYPTYDLSKARYVSHYLSFVHVDILNHNGKLFQRMSHTELRLYNRFARAPALFKQDPYDIFATIHNASSDRTLPLIAIGDYVQTVAQFLVEGDFDRASTTVAQSGTYVPPTALSFSDVQNALISGKSPPNTHLVVDANGETNVIAALICHANGARPKSVCDQAAIRTILRHVK